MQIFNPPLVPLSYFEKSGRSPVDMRWLIFHQKEALENHGAIVRYGSSRWLVDENRLFDWLKERGKDFSSKKSEIKIDSNQKTDI